MINSVHYVFHYYRFKKFPFNFDTFNLNIALFLYFKLNSSVSLARSCVMLPQLRSTCHYMVIPYVKIWPCVRGGQIICARWARGKEMNHGKYPIFEIQLEKRSYSISSRSLGINNQISVTFSWRKFICFR